VATEEGLNVSLVLGGPHLPRVIKDQVALTSLAGVLTTKHRVYRHQQVPLGAPPNHRPL